MTTEIQTAAPKAPKTLTIRDRLAMPAQRDEIAKALPKHLTAERMIRVTLTALTKTPKLADCDQPSFFAALLTCSQLGLEPDGRHAHLIPYGKSCTLVIDYKGLVELAMNSGKVASIHADKVCENDEFVVDRGRLVTHKIDYRKPRGEAFCYFALITLRDGGEKCEVMTKDEVTAIRNRSKAASSGPWVTDFDEMAKKTVFKRASKWIPQSPELRDALDADDEPLPAKAAPIVSAPLFTTPFPQPVVEVETDELPADIAPVEAVPEPAANHREEVRKTVKAMIAVATPLPNQANVETTLANAKIDFDTFAGWLRTTGRIKEDAMADNFNEIGSSVYDELVALNGKALAKCVTLHGRS